MELFQTALPGPAPDGAGFALRLDFPFRLDHPAAPDDGARLHEPDTGQVFLQPDEIAMRKAEPGIAAELDRDGCVREPPVLQNPANPPIHAFVGAERHLGIDAPVFDPGRVGPAVKPREHAGARPADYRGLPFQRKDERVGPLLHPRRRPLAAEVEEGRRIGHHETVDPALPHEVARAFLPALVFLRRGGHETPRSRCLSLATPSLPVGRGCRQGAFPRPLADDKDSVMKAVFAKRGAVAVRRDGARDPVDASACDASSPTPAS